MPVEDFEKIIEILKKKTKKDWRLILSATIVITLFIWYFLPNISYNIPKIENTDLLFRIIFTTIAWGICITLIIQSNLLKKNNTNLPGIGFLIDTSVLNGKIFEKELFFKNFCKETNGKFKIIVYDDKKIKDNNTISYLLEKKKLNIIFVIDEVSAKKNGEDIYTFEIRTVNFQFSSNYSNIELLAESLSYEIINAMNKYIEIHKNNNLDDSTKYANILSAQVSYLMSILYIISPTPEKAFLLLDSIGYIVNNSSERSLRYIKKKLPYRYVDAYNNVISNIINSNEYYTDLSKLDLLMEYILNEEKYIEKAFYNQRFDKKDYILFKDILYHTKAIALYEKGNIDEALNNIEKISPDIANTLTKHLNFAFLYGCSNNYQLCYKYYNKVKNRKDLDEENSISALNEIRDFINKHLDLKPKDEGLKFCSAITNILFADKNLGTTQLKELACSNNEINKIYAELIDDKYN